MKTGKIINKNKNIIKTHILDSMKNLVSDGETIASGQEDNFSEFAETNGYDIELVEEVYYENEKELTEIWLNSQK